MGYSRTWRLRLKGRKHNGARVPDAVYLFLGAVSSNEFLISKRLMEAAYGSPGAPFGENPWNTCSDISPTYIKDLWSFVHH